MSPGTLSEIAPGVLVATSTLYTNTTTVVAGPAGTCLVIDPALTPDELTALAGSLAARGLHPVAGWATHPHFDHMLWHAALGDVPRYATPAAAKVAAAAHDDFVAGAAEAAPGHDPSLIGAVTPLSGIRVPWDGPTAEIVVHDGHAPGHGAVFLPDSGILVAGDMCSDIEMPLLDPGMPEDLAGRLEAYRTGLALLAGLSGVRQVVPGHGHVGDAAEFRRRLAADDAYLDLLARGEDSDDPRITGEAREFHEEQLRYFSR